MAARLRRKGIATTEVQSEKSVPARASARRLGITEPHACGHQIVTPRPLHAPGAGERLPGSCNATRPRYDAPRTPPKGTVVLRATRRPGSSVGSPFPRSRSP